MTNNNNLNKYQKLSIAGGVTSLIGCIVWEVYRIKRSIASLGVNKNVLDLDTKKPDYIYIKYPIYRENVMKMKRKEQQSKVLNTLIQPIGRWWKTLKHSIAWRLLKMAKTGDQEQRHKAVHQLVLLNHLKDWDFQHLAQLCDARTAISLARSGSDLRWFLPPKFKGIVKNSKTQLIDIRKILEELLPSKCVSYFLERTYKHYQIKEPLMDDLFVSHGEDIPQKDVDMLKQCIEFFLHISGKRDVAKQIIELGGLQTLVEIYKIFEDDMDSQVMICQIISNLSLCLDKSYDFFATGWIGILAKWSKNIDMRLKVTASKCLSNLDTDDPRSFTYPSKVYPLHPLNRIKHNPDLDIVFIHGILGGVFVTWRQKDRFCTEIGLYGKEDGGARPEKMDNNGNKNGNKNIDTHRKPDIKAAEEISDKEMIKSRIENMSDLKAKEIIQSLESENELSSDWEVVFHDCPVESNDDEPGVNFSISGEKWSNEDDEDYTYCWPMDWLPEDYPNIRILGMNYQSALFAWAANGKCPCEKSTLPLADRASEFLKFLSESGIGQDRPVVWVGHSMGGILAKSIIVQSLESSDPKIRAIGENTRAVMFLGTPHRGSAVARLKQHTQFILSPSVEVVEMEENAKPLLMLHEKFLKSLRNLPNLIDIVSVAEGMPTVITSWKFPVWIVPEKSAQINTGEFYLINEDHIGLTKPIFRQSFLYMRLLKLIDSSLKNI